MMGSSFLQAVVGASVLALACYPGCGETTQPATDKITPVMTDITAGLKLIDEIDTAKVAPYYESAPGVSQVQDILGRPARVLPPGDKAEAIAYMIGKGKGLVAGNAYILTVDYPDDISRTIFLANRGADYVRGWSTGKAWGDTRAQFTEPSVESLNYPQSGQWQTYKEFFCLMNRMQGLKNARDPKVRHRDLVPADGFNVIIFQSKKINDPRSEGAAVGKIKLYEVPDPAALAATIHYPPADLPRRHIFQREEMGDMAIEGVGKANAFDDTVDWYRAKIKMAKILAINTFTKDLLEFGHNQGWETGDIHWLNEGQPPNVDLWTRLVPVVAASGMDILPYYEYAGAIGIGPDSHSLGSQRRAEKLYHGIRGRNYTGVFWAENNDADLTDPDTLKDFELILDKTVIRFKDQAQFPGIWLRTRNTHLPISFSDATIARFKADKAGDAQAQTADQKTLIASYEGDKALYRQYIDWWFGKRVQFLTALRDYLRQQLGRNDVQVLFTPWPEETLPVLHEGLDGHAGVVTDDSTWWKNYANTIDDGFYKWHMMPTDFDTVIRENLFETDLKEQHPINGNDEQFHSAPVADPEHYKNVEDVMMTYPIGRLFTVTNPQALEDFRAASGLTVVRHTPLNEDEDPNGSPSPFDHLVGYIATDTDHAGPNMMLVQARAIAYGDPRNLAYLCASSFSTGFPEIMRRFDQAFLAVPALPSTKLDHASSDPDVVVREIPTPKSGTYYYIVNTSMQSKAGVSVEFLAKGSVTNLVTGEKEAGTTLKLDLDAADLRAYRVGP